MSRLALERRLAAVERARHSHDHALYAEIRRDKREKALFEELISVQADADNEARVCGELSRAVSAGSSAKAVLQVRQPP